MLFGNFQVIFKWAKVLSNSLVPILSKLSQKYQNLLSFILAQDECSLSWVTFSKFIQTVTLKEFKSHAKSRKLSSIKSSINNDLGISPCAQSWNPLETEPPFRNCRKIRIITILLFFFRTATHNFLSLNGKSILLYGLPLSQMLGELPKL